MSTGTYSPDRDAGPPRDGPPAAFLRRPALYPDLYTWYVFVSSLDILFTWLILTYGGREVNALANWIIDSHDVFGLVLFKFITVVLVVLICETVGRRRHLLGAKLARWAVALSAFPVVVGGVHLLRIALAAHGR